MSKLFDQLQVDIETFVEQRDDLILVAACTDADAPLVAQIVGQVEQANGTDIFLVFPDSFTQTQPYVDVIVERIREQHTIANKALEEDGQAPMQPFPDELADAQRPPAQRLHEAIVFARTLVPQEGGHRLVWALTPLEIHDRAAYLALINTLIPWEGVEPWMRGVRLLVRDAPNDSALATRFEHAPRVSLRPVDFGPTALEESMREEVEDETLSDEQRMNTLLSLALLDYAHGRAQDAVTKLEILLGYYQHAKSGAMQAFVLNSLGDVYHRNDELGRAREWYECALVPLAESPAPVILFSVLKNLGQVVYKQGDFSTAEQYFEIVDETATHMRDPEGKAWAMEWRGRSQEAQGDVGRAIESWKGAATLSRSISLDEPLQSNLQHLERTYGAAQMHREREEVMAELQSLDSGAA